MEKKRPMSLQDLLNTRQQVEPLVDLDQNSEDSLSDFSPLSAIKNFGSEFSGADELEKKRFAQRLSQYGQDPTIAQQLAKGEFNIEPTAPPMSIGTPSSIIPNEAERNLASEIKPKSKKEEIESIKSLLNKLSPSSAQQQETPEQQLAQPKAPTSDEEMKNILEQYKQNVARANLGRGLSRAVELAGGQLGFKTDEEGYKQALKEAEIPVTLLEKQRKADTELQTKQKAADYANPSSQRSKVARDIAKQYLGIAGLKDMAGRITEDMSAEQIDTLTKGIFKDAVDQQMDMRKLQESVLARKELSEAKAEQQKESAKEKVKLSEEKKNAVLKDVSQRQQDINDNLNDLEKMIDKYGTFEVFGSHNQDLDRKVDQIATDMAKLMDPNSVARPSEVELVKQGLIKSGFQNTNATAQEIIKNFKNEVNRRTQTAYEIRGLEAPALLSRDKTSLPKERIVGGKKFILQSDGSYEEAD